MKDVYDTIDKAADIAIPKFKIPSLKNNMIKFTPKPWWNELCSKAVAYRRLAFTNFKHNITPINYQKYLTAQLQARYTIQKAKKKKINRLGKSVRRNKQHKKLIQGLEFG